MLIRLASPEELPQLAAVARAAESAAQWSQAQWGDIFSTENPARLAWLCEADSATADGPEASREGGGVAGFVVAQCAGPDWELENLAVLPSVRRRGAGLALLSALLAEARLRGAERILLEVRASNLPAIRLYEQAGFRALARRRGYYAHPVEDALIYVHSF